MVVNFDRVWLKGKKRLMTEFVLLTLSEYQVEICWIEYESFRPNKSVILSQVLL